MLKDDMEHSLVAAFELSDMYDFHVVRFLTCDCGAEERAGGQGVACLK